MLFEIRQAAAFHDQFVAALSGAGSAYANAELAASNLLGGGAAASSAVMGADPPLPTLTGPTIGLVMGGSGLPIPPPSYISAVLNWVNFAPNAPVEDSLPLSCRKKRMAENRWLTMLFLGGCCFELNEFGIVNRFFPQRFRIEIVSRCFLLQGAGQHN